MSSSSLLDVNKDLKDAKSFCGWCNVWSRFSRLFHVQVGLKFLLSQISYSRKKAGEVFFYFLCTVTVNNSPSLQTVSLKSLIEACTRCTKCARMHSNIAWLTGCLCRGGTKSPLSPLSAIMLIFLKVIPLSSVMNANPLSCRQVADGWRVDNTVFFCYSYKRLTCTFTDDSPVTWQCENWPLVW